MSKRNLEVVDTQSGEASQSAEQFSPDEVEQMRVLARRVIESGEVIDKPPEFSSDDEKWEFGRELALEGRKLADRSSQQMGLGLLLMRDTKRHGEWEAFVKREIGVTPRHATGLMKVAEFLASLPAANRKRVSDLSFRRQQQLARLGEDKFDLLLAEINDDIETLANAPDKQFNALIKAQKERDSALQATEQARQERDDALGRLEKFVHHNPMTHLNQARLVIAEHVSAVRLLGAAAFRALEKELQECPYDDDETKEMIVRHLLQGYREVAMTMNAFEERVKDRWAHLLHGNDDGLPVELDEGQKREARDYIESLMSNWRAFDKPAGTHLEGLFELDPLNPDFDPSTQQHGKDRKRPGQNRQKGRKKTR